MKTLEAVLTLPMIRQQMAQQYTVDRDYDVPYRVGYSVDGRTFYIDRDMPRAMMYRGRDVALDPILLMRARVEKAVLDAYRRKYDRIEDLLGCIWPGTPEPLWHLKSLPREIEEQEVRKVVNIAGLEHYQNFMRGRDKDKDALLRLPRNFDDGMI